MHFSSVWPPSTPEARLAYPTASMEASDGELARVVATAAAGALAAEAFDVRVHTADGVAPVRTFLVPHVFEER